MIKLFIKQIRFFFYVIIAVLLVSCGSNKEKKMNLFVAASMTEAIDSIARNYSEKAGVSFVINTASSGTLAKQIEQGAPATVFISANKSWADYLMQTGMLRKDDVGIIASNKLVLIKSKLSKTMVENLTSICKILNEKGKVAIGTPEHVPAGKYAKEALVNLGKFDSLKNAFIYTKDVRAALILAELEEANYAIVYKTDAFNSKNIQIVEEINDSLHSPIELSACLVDTLSIGFYEYLFTKESKEVLKYFGYKVD